MPGPGSYNPRDHINPEGTYCLSNYKNSVTRKFGRTSVSGYESARSVRESRDQF